MDKCISCGKKRLAKIGAKCDDNCAVAVGGRAKHGYAPSDMELGPGGDYVIFRYCLDCGQIQGDFPLNQTELEAVAEEDEDEENEEEDDSLDFS